MTILLQAIEELVFGCIEPTNVEIFHKSNDYMKIDDFSSLRAINDPLDPLNHKEVLQILKKHITILKW